MSFELGLFQKIIIIKANKVRSRLFCNQIQKIIQNNPIAFSSDFQQHILIRLKIAILNIIFTSEYEG